MKKIFLSLIICFLVLQSNAQNDSIDIQHYDINLDINNENLYSDSDFSADEISIDEDEISLWDV